MDIPCPKCKRIKPAYCKDKDCPYFVKKKYTLKKDFVGKTPNLFVGSYGYPNVNIGFLVTDNYNNNDDPALWSRHETKIPKIIELRASLINSKFKGDISNFSEKIMDAQLIAQASKAADIEVSLDKAPSYRINYPSGLKPHGASASLIKSKIVGNVRVPKAVEKVVSDHEIKASEALRTLYKKQSIYQLPKLLSAGVIGTKRKLVPTRWSITAVDDTIGKQLINKIKDYPVINEPRALFGGHYGNYYLILLFARNWQYELFEFMTTSNKLWTDYESYSGRKNYAKDTAGGYYAARISVLEYLKNIKRQASCLVIRIVTKEYTNPLGVWVVREAVKKACGKKHLIFSDSNLLIMYARAKCKQFGIKYDEMIGKKSRLIASLKQRAITDY